MVEFRILGPLEVTSSGRPLEISGQQRRLLLAAFLLHPNRPLSVQTLRGWLWADNPADVRNAMHTALSKLRRSLRPADPAAGSEALRTVRSHIHTHETGYELVAGSEQLDSLRFARLTAEARAALARDHDDAGDGRIEQAAATLREALVLWRGDQVLEGLHLPEPLLTEAARLQSLRLEALETRIEADLALDRHGDLLTELDALVDAHPDHEHFHAQLMLARYRSGRQVAALGAYQLAYRTLVDRYGVEPSPQLQHLQRRMLARDPSLDSPAQAARRGGRPYDLPAAPPRLVGRDAASRALESMLTAAGADPVVVVHGAAGAGKTALTVTVAHRLRARFPHGTVLVDLHGSSDRPAEPAEVLRHFLHALGVRDAAVPAGLRALTLQVRTLLADRRVLLVLDDAAGEAQVRPLLAATAGAVVVTSRTPLHALQVTGKLGLGPLAAADAVTLLGLSVHPLEGAARVEAEPAAGRQVARWCGYLPLALRIAGGKLAARPSWSLSTLAARLRDRGLDELRLGDLDLRAVLDSSYARLTAAQQRALRLLALAEDLDVAPWAVTALLDSSPQASGDLLDELADVHLLEYGNDGRYRLPELLQRYAAERLAAEESDEQRTAARDRFLEVAAAASLPPTRLPHVAGTAPPRREPGN